MSRFHVVMVTITVSDILIRVIVLTVLHFPPESVFPPVGITGIYGPVIDHIDGPIESFLFLHNFTVSPSRASVCGCVPASVDSLLNIYTIVGSSSFVNGSARICTKLKDKSE